MEEANRSRGESLVFTPEHEKSNKGTHQRQSSGVARRLTDDLGDQMESASGRDRVPSYLSSESRAVHFKQHGQLKEKTGIDPSDYDELLMQKTAQIELLEARLKQREEELVRMEAKCLALHDSTKIANLWNKLYSVCEELNELSPHPQRKTNMESENSSLAGEATIVRTRQIEQLELPEENAQQTDGLRTRRVSNFEQELASAASFAEPMEDRVVTQTSIPQEPQIKYLPTQFIDISHENTQDLFSLEEHEDDDQYVPAPYREPVSERATEVKVTRSLMVSPKNLNVHIKAEHTRKQSQCIIPDASEQKPRPFDESASTSPSKLPSQYHFKALTQLLVDCFVHICKLQCRIFKSFSSSELPFLQSSIDQLTDHFNLKYRQCQSKRLDPASLELDTLRKSQALFARLKTACAG